MPGSPQGCPVSPGGAHIRVPPNPDVPPTLGQRRDPTPNGNRQPCGKTVNPPESWPPVRVFCGNKAVRPNQTGSPCKPTADLRTANCRTINAQRTKLHTSTHRLTRPLEPAHAPPHSIRHNFSPGEQSHEEIFTAFLISVYLGLCNIG